jgi:hypothetical protein
MAAPARKRVDLPSVPLSPGGPESGPADADETDLETFRAMRPVSRRATAKELEELIRPSA